MTPRWPSIRGWALPRRLQRRQAEADALSDPAAGDPWAEVPAALERVEPPVSLLLSEIEAGACAIYARHGLPDRPGHYARSQQTKVWRFLSETLTAEERWTLVTAQRPGSAWRFGTLDDLGDQADSPPEVRRAARMLSQCRRLRARLREGGGLSLAEDLEAAIRLGMEWRQVEAAPLAAIAVVSDAAGAPEIDLVSPALSGQDSDLALPHKEPLRFSVPKKARSPRKPRTPAKPKA